MRRRFWLAALLICILGIPFGNCLSQESSVEPSLGVARPIGELNLLVLADESPERDLPSKPLLGAAQPIGRLLVVDALSAVFNAVYIDESPQLGSPILLASLIPMEVPEESVPRVLSPIQPTHPDEIQNHLRQAALLLASTGLVNESDEIRKVISRIDDKFHEHLLLNRMEADLARLQAEVDRLRQYVGRVSPEPQVCLSFKLIELDSSGDDESILASADANDPRHALNAAASGYSGVFGEAEANQLWDTLRNHGARILCEPKLAVRSGMSSRFRLIDEGSSNLSSVTSGTDLLGKDEQMLLIIKPELTEASEIRLDFQAEFTQLDHEIAFDFPAICSNRIWSTFELQTGQSFVLARNGKFVVVSAELIPPALKK